MTQSQNSSIKQILGLTIAVLMLLGYQYTSAQWTNPPSGTVPPANNTPTPVNVGSSPQSKLGNLGVIDLVASDYVKAGLVMWSPEYCDQNGQNCFTSADVKTSSATGQQVYACPVSPVTDGCYADTCKGQLQTSSTCIDSIMNSSMVCQNYNESCPAVGHLAP